MPREVMLKRDWNSNKRAVEKIMKSLQILGYQPQIGRPVKDMPDEYREWVIDFGDSGYVA